MLYGRRTVPTSSKQTLRTNKDLSVSLHTFFPSQTPPPNTQCSNAGKHLFCRDARSTTSRQSRCHWLLLRFRVFLDPVDHGFNLFGSNSPPLAA